MMPATAPATNKNTSNEKVKSEPFFYQHHDGRTITVRIELRPNGRYALDLRHPLGGGRVAITTPGTKQGVKSIADARRYAPNILRPIFDRTTSGALPPVTRGTGMQDLVEKHLAAKKAGRHYGPETLKQADLAIRRLLGIAYHELGVRKLSDLTRLGVSELVTHMRALTNKRGEPLSDRYIRQQFMYLSGLYTWAVEMKAIEANPLLRHPDIPAMPRRSSRAWLEPSQAQALLDELRRSVHHHSPHLFYIIAVQLYTGMTPAECLGLMVSDIHWDIDKIHVKPHPHRRLKNEYRERWVRIWPRLAEYLREHIEKHKIPADGLLFPKPGVVQLEGAARAKAMWKCIRAGTVTAAERAGIKATITPYVMRHTFCSVRLCMVETLPNDAGFVPVARETVSDEMGHGTGDMVDNIYRHPLLERNKHRQVALDYEAMRA